jgi:hypothetical protein
MQMVSTCFSALATYSFIFIFLKDMKISNFGSMSKFLKLIVFGQILANFGYFGQFWIVLGKFWCIVDESMPKARLKS